MKNLRFVTLILLAIVFISCSSDDDNGSQKLTKENFVGTYQLKSYSSTETKKSKVEGFTIETKTTSEGDTFNLTYDFANNNEVTLNGNFRITQVKKQGNNTSDTTFIVNHNEEKLNYNLQSEQKRLKIDGKDYDVKRFNANGFELHHSEKTSDGEGNSREYEEKMRFSK